MVFVIENFTWKISNRGNLLNAFPFKQRSDYNTLIQHLIKFSQMTPSQYLPYFLSSIFLRNQWKDLMRSSNLMTWKGCENSVEHFFLLSLKLFNKRTKSSKNFSLSPLFSSTNRKLKRVTNEKKEGKGKTRKNPFHQLHLI